MSTPHQPPATRSIDIGGMIQFVLDDPDWWRKAILPGLCAIIPLVGPIVHLGWRRRMFHHIRGGGKGLLPLDFGGDLSEGVAPFVALITAGVAMLIISSLCVVPGFLIVALGAALEAQALAALGGIVMFAGQLAMLPLMLIMAIFMVELLRRSFHGEMTPIFSPGESIRRIRSHASDYIITFVAQFVASFIGSLGMYACGVGIIVTLPAGHAMSAHALAQWDALSAP